MKYSEHHPELTDLEGMEFVKKIPVRMIFTCIANISKYYDERLKLWEVLNYYGADAGGGNSEKQVRCLLFEHGSQDVHLSAKYYPTDRNLDTDSESVFCFKCGKLMRSFWLIFTYERDYKQNGILEVLELIDSVFHIKFPRYLIMDFDPDIFYTMEASNDKINKILRIKSESSALREMKGYDKSQFISQVFSTYKSLQ